MTNSFAVMHYSFDHIVIYVFERKPIFTLYTETAYKSTCVHVWELEVKSLWAEG